MMASTSSKLLMWMLWVAFASGQQGDGFLKLRNLTNATSQQHLRGQPGEMEKVRSTVSGVEMGTSITFSRGSGRRYCRGTLSPPLFGGVTSDNCQDQYGNGEYVLERDIPTSHECAKRCMQASWCVGFNYAVGDNPSHGPDWEAGSCQLLSKLVEIHTAVENVVSYKVLSCPTCLASAIEAASTIRAAARIANAIYDQRPTGVIETRLDDWWLVGEHFVAEGSKHYTAAVYKKQNSVTCMLVFAGTDETADWSNNLNYARSRSSCSSEYSHFTTGFWDEYQAYVSHETWARQIEPYLQQCCCVIATGHSLGGAVATIASTCHRTSPEAKNGWYVHGLITFGAPKPFVTDSAGGALLLPDCLPGFRFYASTVVADDPIPWFPVATTGLLRTFAHPNLKRVNLADTPWGKQKVIVACGESQWKFAGFASRPLHNMNRTYLPWILELY
mmetsp:Transcript_60324/g.112716  ORF Transcript_60324/g.112716 Transcript_60324/m.112716 type:complete len:445 (-) Transcript_60324:130-1464(-)